jgi:hypothetical protein
VRRLPSETLHRVIDTHGLETCGELVALATPAQLAGVFDLDLWKPAQPGRDELFDATRFGLWLEVLVEQGDAVAARALAHMDSSLAVTAFAQHVRVFDGAVPAPEGLADETIGGYQIVATRTDAWDAVVCALAALYAEEPDSFRRVMQGCRGLSDAGWELDGLDTLLHARGQAMVEVALARDERREAQGYVGAAEARAFLRAARAAPISAPVAPGVLTARAAPLAHFERQMRAVRDLDESAYVARGHELAQLANTLLAGCSRPLSPPQASQAVMAVCNLELESRLPLPDDFLVSQVLTDVFRAGWALLHDRVSTHAAARLLETLAEIRCSNRDIQSGVVQLRVEMKRALAAGEPWIARDAMDVVASLDQVAWSALLALIDELPVLPDAIVALRSGRHTVDPAAFEFIASHAQIGAIHTFLIDLPATLVG